jgi:acyl transferase domain-containing protein/acyl carrier protein
MAGQFPGATNVEAFWQNIAAGKNCISEVPGKRWNMDNYYQEGEAVPGKSYSKWMGALEEYDLFDPLFFNISPSEAESMDPQQRLFLQTCWHTIENAGYDPRELSGSRCGVFVGCAAGDYLQKSQKHQLSAHGFTGAANSILAARISYFLNLQGPCISIDTACSSSLVAIASACDSLTTGSSDLALAGGVYVMATPSMLIMSSQSGMLSPDGKCYTFDQRANGFVPGEGVGVVMLKRLEDAERDHDNILGVIHGWGVNQDGKTNGITAPNTESQVLLEQQVYDKFHIDPNSIQLIEAHGTGTKLGDPIEVEGLRRAFKKYTQGKDYCALGSVKSNIGHCLTAAGVAGFIKVLQAIKHKQLPPTINFEQLNEHINLDDSPFYINTQLKNWSIKDMERRQAAISSFGFSGTNAHLVLGEYIPQLTTRRLAQVITQNSELMIPLSARTVGQLKQKAYDLLEYLKTEGESDDLIDIAYTLQVGRQAMEERVGFMVSSIGQLADKLQAYINGEDGIAGVYQGQVKRNKEGLRIISNDDEMKETIITNWISQKKLSKLLDLWVKGLDLDWSKFYGDIKPRRVSLPVYPFAKERYWIEKADKITAGAVTTTGGLHPLLHRNTSDLRQQSYRSTFSGEEFFIYNSEVDGHKVVPPMVCLEMARAAVMMANPPGDRPAVVELRNILWKHPIVFAENSEIATALFANETQDRLDEQIDFEIYSEAERDVIYFQGQAIYSYQLEAARQDIAQLKGQMVQAPDTHSIYTGLTGMGFAYGPAYQGIAAVYRGNDQLLAELNLPSSEAGDQDGFVLHPIVMEGALQAGIGLITGLRSFSRPLISVSVESVRVIAACTRLMVIWVRCKDIRLSGAKLDIDLIDQQGNVCVQMRGLSLQELTIDADTSGSNEKADEKSEIVDSNEVSKEASFQLFFEEYWQDQPLTSNGLLPDGKQTIIFADEELQDKITNHDGAGQLAKAIFVYQGKTYKEVSDVVYHCCLDNVTDIEKVLSSVSRRSGTPITLVYAWAKDKKEAGIYALFNLFKVIREFDHPVDVILVGHYDPLSSDTCWDYSWIGFERSLKLVLPNVRISLLYTDSSVYTPGQLLDAAQHPGVIWYRDQCRFTLSFKPSAPGNLSPEPVLTKNGSYLITGGCGKLGFRFAQYLAKEYQAKLLLLGRSPLTADIQEKMDQLKQAGAQEVSYESVNISDRNAMTSWAQKLPSNLSGIIHAAGVESTQPFYERTVDSIGEVLQPKSSGTILLDELLDRHPLDFVCYFSSSAALLGDFGTCDYAIANRFQMAYAQYRRQKKDSRSIVINWPFWQDGGMGKGDADKAAFYLKSSGQEMLSTSEGLEIWHNIIRSDQTQTLVLKGKPTRVEQFLRRIYEAGQHGQSLLTTQNLPSHISKGWKIQYQDLPLKECVYADLVSLVSAILKISSEKLDGVTNLVDYGFDSISLTTFAKQLNEYFSLAVTPALFYNYSTIEKLSEHFAQDYHKHMQEFYSRPRSKANDKEHTAANRPANNKTSARKRFLEDKSNGRSYAGGVMQEPIAVIGMSGRFPKADTVDQLWTLLEKGDSGISEIPLSRWNWLDYFKAPGDPTNKISTNKGGFINNVDEFDPLFFEITPREAEATDPGQRLLLMEAYKAIEDAQIDPSSLRGSSVGVFVGMEESQYESLVADEQGVGNSGNAMISSRLSYYLDLHGPTIATNTACSSGLVALHQAIMSLRNGECESALVAGISTFILSPAFYVKMSEAGMLSEDGQCYSFAKKANGIGASEAVVVLMLKPLSAAIAAGNPIYGTIKASGINFDGKTNGVTAPNGKSQEELIKNIYTNYRVDPRDITHIVAHGTGTRLGDPVELNALNEAFRKLGNGSSYSKGAAHCAITSCKSNLGHTMAASGLVSVVSLLKGLQHNKIPASINCEVENDYITWEDSPFYINKTTKEWEKEPGKPRMGGVSSFGRSGTNAHVVIEEFMPAAVVSSSSAIHRGDDTQVIIALSAKTEEQLRQKAVDLLDFVSIPDRVIDLFALAYSLQVTREAMEVRAGFIVGSIHELEGKLREYLNGKKSIEGVYLGEVKLYDTSVSIFNIDADLQETVAKWIANGKLSKLLELWVKGLKLDWNKLYGEVKPRRISLPKYPFAKERYWIRKANPKQVSETRSVAVDKDYGIMEELINQIESESIGTDQAVSLLKNIVYTK